MSRHEIPSAIPACKTFVGWDNPLMTFFGQVYREDAASQIEDDESDGEGPVHWCGTNWMELPEVEDLARAMQSWVLLSAEVCRLLFDDRDLGR